MITRRRRRETLNGTLGIAWTLQTSLGSWRQASTSTMMEYFDRGRSSLHQQYFAKIRNMTACGNKRACLLENWTQLFSAWPLDRWRHQHRIEQHSHHWRLEWSQAHPGDPSANWTQRVRHQAVTIANWNEEWSRIHVQRTKIVSLKYNLKPDSRVGHGVVRLKGSTDMLFDRAPSHSWTSLGRFDWFWWPCCAFGQLWLCWWTISMPLLARLSTRSSRLSRPNMSEWLGLCVSDYCYRCLNSGPFSWYQVLSVAQWTL